ncbi:glycosyltransferase family 4 protein [Stutzerimonas xanthomarina]|uniref:glycosyltransferase family 4 protein n=1 Tax=Stutzerimonas xanthomarina TaxID=271420 RepID=UPI003AA84C36
MKIALIGTTASCVIGFRADLIRSLVVRGHDVFAFALDYTEVTRKIVEEIGARPVSYVFSRTGLNPLSDIINTYKLYRLVKNNRFDIVFSYFSKPAIFGTLAAAFARVPLRVAMLEGLGFVFTDQPSGLKITTKILRNIQVLLYRMAFPLLHQIIFLNPDDSRDLLDAYSVKVKRVNILGAIGLDLADYKYSSPDVSCVSFILVGRLLAEKGVNEYIAAAKVVKQSYPSACFYLLGGLDEGNPGALSKSDLDKLIEEDVIVFPGYVADVRSWLRRASVFVLPSYREGLPRSTQEAMAIGRPVITTDVPGCRETVVDGVNGFLVPKWNVDALVGKMIYFIENPEAVEMMGLESHKMAVDKFDAEKANYRLMNIMGLI